ncbi:PrsW family glutamic-type intramembrane protease [Elongatibacter sediminis]|uniref:PrsW family glutamic-type intramembrane protease n=1 Tax=Elongatibacter sediminis TaxID=3119006 RepID=A0AAW9RDA4_9GAMM
MLDLALKSVIACLPVIVLAAALFHLDSHRLLGTHFLARMFLCGGVTAVLSAVVNAQVIAAYPFEFLDYTRYVAPLIEESLKAAVLIWLFRTNRVGFLIDAGILGFTIGAGFSFVENIYYLHLVSDAHYVTWFVRGFGTAVMHGGATALFAIIAQKLTERHLQMNPLLYLPGLIVAVLIHSIFNHFPVSPVLSAAVTLLILPTLLFLLFERNTVSIHNFLELDFATHQRLLRQLEHGEFTGCEAGRFLLDLEQIVPEAVARDMINYFYLHTELVLGAERILLAREQGIEIRIGAETVAKLEEMHRLERHIGRAGLKMLRQHLHFSSTELWDIHLLDEIAPAPAHRPT